MRATSPTVVLIFALSACSDYTVKATAQADGLLASLTADPAVLDFGGTPLGARVQGTIALHNPGDIVVTVEGYDIGQQGIFDLDGEEGAPRTVAPGDTASFDVGFRPEAPWTEGILRVSTNGGPVDVGLQGEGWLPSLLVEPTSVDGGVLFPGCQTSFSVSLLNEGEAPATVSGLGLIGESASLVDTPGLPLELAPGKQIELFGLLDGRDLGELDATLIVDGESPAVPLQVPVHGRVDARPRYEEQFVQDGPWDAVDIVMVVDRSGSMAEEREKLAAGLTTMLAALEEQQLDWRVGVVTADSGCMNGGFDVDAPVSESAFNDLLNGPWGRLTESGLTLARNAVDEAGDDGCNLGFFRSEARPAFFFLSDEPDQSEEPWADLVEDLRSWNNAVSLSAIVGPAPEGCATAAQGTGYLDAADATGGAQLSICEEDWRPWLADESGRLAGDPTGTFVLTEGVAPDGDVLVWVDGEPEDGFVVDMDNNAIVFAAHRWPGPGARIEVDYPLETACD